MKYLLMVLALGVSYSVANAMDFPPCYDQEGNRAAVIEGYSSVESPAYSTLRNGYPTIIFNDTFLNEVPNSRSVLGYIYLHECGHIALGHVYENTNSAAQVKRQELQADCYAAKAIRKLNGDDNHYININAVLREVLTWPTDPEHPSGQVRAQVIAQCYQQE